MRVNRDVVGDPPSGEGSYVYSLVAWSRRLAAAAIALVVCLGSATRASAQFHPIELGTIDRVAGQAGTEIDLRVQGGVRTEEATALRFSDPRLSAELRTLDPLPLGDEPLPDYGHFRVRIDADTPPGRYELRVIGRHGVSHPFPFLVSEHATLMLESVGHDASSSTTLPLDTIVQAKTTSSQVDHYRLTFESGQTINIEMIAQQLNSSLIGRLELLDPEGRVVASNRGSDRADPRLRYTSTDGGIYQLRVHDFLYRGGLDFFYLLVATSGDAEPTLIDRWRSPSSVTVNRELPATVASESMLQPPCSIEASFDSAGDEDVYEFVATKGQQYAVEVISHRIGEPTDPRLVILKRSEADSAESQFQRILDADDSQQVGGVDVSLRSKDPQAMFTAPADGTYRVLVRDLDTGETLKKTQRYVLAIRDPQPSVTLAAYRAFPNPDVNQSRPFGSKLFRGGSEAIRVLAFRHDQWSGPIRVAVSGLPDGVIAEPAIIAAGQSETQITVTATEQAASWIGPVSVTGTYQADGTEQTVVAEPVAITRGRAHGREFIEASRTHDLMLSVSADDLTPTSIELGPPADADTKVDESAKPPWQVAKNGSLTIPIKLNRREGGKETCVLRPRDLPAGITAAEVSVPGDQTDAKLELKVSPQAVVASYTFWLQAETKIKTKPNPQALERTEQYRTRLQSMRDDPDRSVDAAAIDEALKLAEERVKAATSDAQPQESTVFLPSPLISIQVIDSQ